MPKKRNRKGTRNPKKKKGKKSKSNKQNKKRTRYPSNEESEKFILSQGVEFLSSLIELEPNNHELYAKRSEAYCFLEKYQEAINDTDRFITLQPHLSRGYILKSSALLRRDKRSDWRNTAARQYIVGAFLGSFPNKVDNIIQIKSDKTFARKFTSTNSRKIVIAVLHELSDWNSNLYVPPLVYALCLLYYEMWDKWDKNRKSKSINICGTNSIRVQSGKPQQTAYCKNVISDGIHAWIFKLVKYNNYQPPSVCIGIRKFEADEAELADTNAALSQGSNVIYGYNVDFQTLSNYKEYGQYCLEGDVIVMILDMNKLTLRYTHNAKDYGVAYTVEKVEYKAFVSVSCGKNTIIELVDSY